MKLDRAINRETSGRHRIIAFMDDIKVHSPTQLGLELRTAAIETAGEELGLALNQRKSEMFVGRQVGGDEEAIQDHEESMFLPAVRSGYKYLGIVQLERDTSVNEAMVKEKVLDLTNKIFAPDLAVPQKVRLYNTAAIPALVYVIDNLYSADRAATVLVRCREMDKKVRKVLNYVGVRTKTTSIAGTYIPEDMGGLGLLSLEEEVEIHHVRREAYLQMQPDIKEARERFYNCVGKRE